MSIKPVLCCLSLVAACLIVFSTPVATATEYTPVAHSDLQVIYEDGMSAWPSSGQPYPILLVGVVINNPEDMLDYTTYATGLDCVEWQTYIQALPTGTYGTEETGYYTVTTNSSGEEDYGGTAMYMRATKPWPPFDVIYSESQWFSELQNMITNAETLQYGDIVVVKAGAPGKFYNGKYNVNELNSSAPENNFIITVLGNTTPPLARLRLPI